MPSEVGADDADALRAHGLDDEAIHDAIQVIAYFNYINRVAEGVGTEPEPEWEPRTYPPARLRRSRIARSPAARRSPKHARSPTGA